MRRSAPGAIQPPNTGNSPPMIETGRRKSSNESGGMGSRWAAIFGLNRRSDSNNGSGTDVGQLLTGIRSLRLTSKMAAKTSETQMKGAEALTDWAEQTNNNAIGDVMGRTCELLRLGAEKQNTFAKDYEHFLKQLRKVADTEQRLRGQEKEFQKLVERERRLAKQHRQRETVELRLQLHRLSADREVAERDLAEARAEAEVVKMIQLRDGLIGMADAQRNLANALQQIAVCQRELAEFVPAVSTKDVRRMRYEGVAHTRLRVAELRRSLAAEEVSMPYNAPSSVERRRRSEPPAQQQQQQHRWTRFECRQEPLGFGTPPPPYTPSAPPMDLLDGAGRRNIRRCQPNRHSTGIQLPLAEMVGNSSSSISSSPLATNGPNRVYPILPPNPFAEELLKRGQRQQQPAEQGQGRV